MPADRPHEVVRHLAVVGVGMMGGSLALAGQAKAGVNRVVGYDSDSDALRQALELGVITETATSAAEAAAGADLAVVSTPVRSIAGLVEECAGADPAPRVISDMGSTKTAIMAGLSQQARRLFVGGHPMRGAADSGVRYARPGLFEGATYFLCTTDDVPPELCGSVQQFVADLGAKPTHIEPAAHDRIMAAVSHLPHVLANGLMDHAGSVRAGGRRALQCVGASFGDLTRIAGANPPMWKDIFLENREALAESARALALYLEEFSDSLATGDAEAVSRAIETAGAYREEMLEFADITPDTLYKVTVWIPDEPGVIARVMTVLGEAGINVEDLTMHHMSRSVGGDLDVFVSGLDVAEGAAELLNGLGFPSRVAEGRDDAE